MLTADLQEAVHAVLRRAERQGSILPREIREELSNLNLPRTQWKQVVALSRPSLCCRRGRYYYRTTISARLRQEKRQRRAIQQIVRRLIRQYKKDSAWVERRQQGRINFVQSVKVRLEDGRQLAVLSRDLSPAGIRLIGTQSLLGQKIHVVLPALDGGAPICFLLRVLWTCAVGDGLFENGGSFLEAVPDLSEPLKLLGE